MPPTDPERIRRFGQDVVGTLTQVTAMGQAAFRRRVGNPKQPREKAIPWFHLCKPVLMLRSVALQNTGAKGAGGAQRKWSAANDTAREDMARAITETTTCLDVGTGRLQCDWLVAGKTQTIKGLDCRLILAPKKMTQKNAILVQFFSIYPHPRADQE